jgi:hypothetical protein
MCDLQRRKYQSSQKSTPRCYLQSNPSLTKLVDANRVNATYTPSLDTQLIAGGIHAIIRKRPPYDDNSPIHDEPISHRPKNMRSIAVLNAHWL